jgi:threonyl-tRNA synthetase
MLHITLPDGSQRDYASSVTVAEVAASIGAGLAKAALAGKVDGKVVDTSFVIDKDSALSIITAKDAEGLEVIRHSTAHLLAYAVKEIFPTAQVTIGPVIENGFFYDFAFERPFTLDDLAVIEKRMTALAAKDEPVLRRVLEEAEKRDHRKLGRELDLFHVDDHAPGMVFWHPKGWAIWQAVEQYMRQVYRENGYQEVKGPQLLDKGLWEKTGHWDKYRDNMFTTESEKRDYALKPMNCPGHILIFKQGLKSYRDLPLRYGEFGQCHRNEATGGLHGIMRVRGFTQDDGHIFCTEDQILAECVAYTTLLQKVYADFGFKNIIYKIATRPEQRIGSDEIWDKAEHALIESLRASGCEFELSPGEGAFYGPKVEYTLKDAIGRHWQCGTIQVDFSMPERLDADYVGEDSARHRPVMLHRAIVGSLERFIGILIEETAGALPTWLAPVQVKVLNITDAQAEYARDVVKTLQNQGFRVEADLRNEKITYKIREHSMQKVPYLVVIGDKEMASGAVAVRARGGQDLGVMSVAEFVQKMSADVAHKSLV